MTGWMCPQLWISSANTRKPNHVYFEQKARGFKDAEANEVNQLAYSLPEPIKSKVVNSLPAHTINREYKRLKLSIDKKRMKIKQEVKGGNQKMNEAPEK